MIGQNFSPTNNQDQPYGNQGGMAPLQQAIQILRIRMPHLFGGAPSPLAGAGPAMMPPRGVPPLPLPGGGPMDGGGGPVNPLPPPGGGGGRDIWGGPNKNPNPGMPVVNYTPPPALPGGTAGPNPPGTFNPPPFGPRPPMGPRRQPR